jgi:UDPglucose 6-dehydrogenase
MKIIIAGYGFVGKAVANALEPKHELVIQDPKYTDYKMIDHHDADGIIVCVGTPSDAYGDCDASAVFEVLDDVPVFMPVLIKSTVTPAVLEEIVRKYPDHSICYSPEFLRAASSNRDFLDQKTMVIGGDDPEGFWQALFRTVLTKCNLYFFCTMQEASVVKYTINSYLASKVAFFNEIYDLCNATGIDYEKVRHIVTHDNRIGNSHTLVPGPDGSRGFGGACFPKDTQAFVRYAKEVGQPLDILEEVIRSNEKIKTKSS